MRKPSSRGDILEDESLVQRLEKTKHSATVLAHELQEAEVAESAIDAARDMYTCIAKRGRLVFQVWQGLQEVDPLYQNSYSTFLRVFTESLAECSLRDAVDTRTLGQTVVSGRLLDTSSLSRDEAATGACWGATKMCCQHVMHGLYERTSQDCCLPWHFGCFMRRRKCH